MSNYKFDIGQTNLTLKFVLRSLTNFLSSSNIVHLLGEVQTIFTEIPYLNTHLAAGIVARTASSGDCGDFLVKVKNSAPGFAVVLPPFGIGFRDFLSGNSNVYLRAACQRSQLLMMNYVLRVPGGDIAVQRSQAFWLEDIILNGIDVEREWLKP